jgi:hypothetical protein
VQLSRLGFLAPRESLIHKKTPDGAEKKIPDESFKYKWTGHGVIQQHTVRM